MTGNKFIINQNGDIEDTMAHITFDSFMEILIVLNGQSRQLKKLSEENEQLKETIKELELENAKHIGDGEWDIRDITYGHGKFRLEEWGERYHQFYNGDKQLEDEEVVSLLFENEQLKSTNMEMEDYLGRLEESNINLQIKLQKIRDYAKEDGEVKQGIIEKVIMND